MKKRMRRYLSFKFIYTFKSKLFNLRIQKKDPAKDGHDLIFHHSQIVFIHFKDLLNVPYLFIKF